MCYDVTQNQRMLKNLPDTEISNDVFKKIDTIDELSNFEALLENSEFKNKSVRFFPNHLKI